jgi:hypothetical protein
MITGTGITLFVSNNGTGNKTIDIVTGTVTVSISREFNGAVLYPVTTDTVPEYNIPVLYR